MKFFKDMPDKQIGGQQVVSVKEYVVRIIKPSAKPHLPKMVSPAKPKKKRFLPRTANLLIGSALGILAGVAIYLMLRFSGITYGGLETSFIVGLPSILGILASLAIF